MSRSYRYPFCHQVNSAVAKQGGKRLEYELELGFYIGPGNAIGAAIALSEAEDHIFGLCPLNDWVSA